MDEVAKLPYLRPHPRTGMYGFRRPVPQKLWPLFGREFNISFGTRDRDEAARQWRAEYDRTQQLLDLAEAGEYPPLEDEAIEEIVRRWFQQATFPNGGVEFGDPSRGAGFDNPEQLTDSLTPFIRQHLPTVRIGGITFERIKREAISEHHSEFGGFSRLLKSGSYFGSDLSSGNFVALMAARHVFAGVAGSVGAP